MERCVSEELSTWPVQQLRRGPHATIETEDDEFISIERFGGFSCVHK